MVDSRHLLPALAGISREGQITERFTKAVDQLGNPNIDVRIGGLYALERIARNLAADRNAILS